MYFINQKGRVGKTIACVNMAAYLAVIIAFEYVSEEKV